MSEQANNTKVIEANIQARLKEITNVNRIVTNAINLINDAEIKGAHSGPVAEILGWLTGFSQSLAGQVKTLEAAMPTKAEPTKASGEKVVGSTKVEEKAEVKA